MTLFILFKYHWYSRDIVAIITLYYMHILPFFLYYHYLVGKYRSFVLIFNYIYKYWLT